MVADYLLFLSDFGWSYYPVLNTVLNKRINFDQISGDSK